MGKIAAGAGVAARSNQRQVSNAIEDAMIEAVRDCERRGIRNPTEIKKAMLEARERARKAK